MTYDDPLKQDESVVGALWIDNKGLVKYVQHKNDKTPVAWERLEDKDEKGYGPEPPWRDIDAVESVEDILIITLKHPNPGCCIRYRSGNRWKWRPC